MYAFRDLDVSQEDFYNCFMIIHDCSIIIVLHFIIHKNCYVVILSEINIYIYIIFIGLYTFS